MKYPSIIIMLSFLAACNNTVAPDTKAVLSTEETSSKISLTAEQLKNAQLEIGKAEMRVLGNILKANGFVEAPPQNKISISIPLGGYLKHTKLLPGMRVHRGELLASIEDPQYINLQQEYLTTNARLSYLSTDLSRQEALNQDKSVSDKALQMARSEYQVQKIALKALSEKLRLIGLDPDHLTADNISKSIQIYSPINGFVSEVKANIGKFVSPTDVLFELVNADDIYLNISVFEKDLASLRVGQKLVAYTNADPAKKYLAKIVLMGQHVGDDRTANLYCHFDKAPDGLLPGMFMSAEIETTQLHALSVPNASIVLYAQKHYVFEALDDLTFEMIEVETGASENGYTALIGSKSEMLKSKNIVTRNAYTLLMKMKNTEE